MSGRSSKSSRMSDDKLGELVCKLQELIPEVRRKGSSKVSTSKILKEACKYIKSLQSEIDNLSESLSAVLASMGCDRVEAELLESLLLQQFS